MDTRLSVSWSAYQKNICNGFSFLQQRGEFVDMTLAADGHHVQVHKVVLCLVSPYIKELVTATQCKHPVIFLNNVSSATLQHILEYAYSGEALVPKNNIKEFLQACNSLNIKGLEHTTTIEQRKDLEESLSQGSGDSKLVEKKHQKSSSFIDDDDDKDPIGASFDDEHHDDKDFYEDDDQEMKITDEPNMTPVRTHKQTMAKKPQHITNTSNESRLQYTVSNSGQLQIILNRYIYSFHYRRNRTDDLVWRCLSNRQKCAATVITKDGRIVRRAKAHNHPFADKSVLKRLQKGIVYSELKDAQDQIKAKNKKDPNTSSNLSMINDDDD